MTSQVLHQMEVLHFAGISPRWSFATDLPNLWGRQRLLRLSGSPDRRCGPRSFRRLQCSNLNPRRSGNYQPNLWSADYIQSLNIHDYSTEENNKKILNLKENVRQIMYKKKEIKDQLELIDALQQLGVSYHFKEDINDALRNLHGSLEDVTFHLKNDLYAVSLLFRLLRQQGLDVVSEIFSNFRGDQNGSFIDTSEHDHDQTEGLLGLYEASHLERPGEHLLDEAREFTSKELKRILQTSAAIGTHLRHRITYALKVPLNRRVPRLHSRAFIEAYQKDENANPLLLEFAKLDYNMIQSTYRRELRQVSEWWTNLGLNEKLPFARDRWMENYLWSVGWVSEPERQYSRVCMTKNICLVTLIDDIYDVYSTLEEAQLFTNAVERWDANMIDELPEYMRTPFLALFNTVDDISTQVMKTKGLNITPYLKTAWTDLCKKYLVEAKWYNDGHIPNYNEYMENAWFSISCHIALTTTYCINDYVSKEILDDFQIYPDIIRWSSIICRLWNDLATSSEELERGDSSKSIECYMHEKSVPKEIAREDMKEMIRYYWKLLNANRDYNSLFEEYFKSVAINIPRMFQFFYQDGDGYGKPDGKTKKQVILVLIRPIP